MDTFVAPLEICRVKDCSKPSTLNRYCVKHHPKSLLKHGGKCVTITFGDVAENHVGMQKMGEKIGLGQYFSYQALKELKKTIPNSELISLSFRGDLPGWADAPARAHLLVIRGGLGDIADDLLTELLELNWDTKVKMYGKVVNKHARHNICFSDEAQEPDYENAKGRVAAFREVPYLTGVRKYMAELLSPLFPEDLSFELQAEGNLYYDVLKTGIGYHGDTERSMVSGIRVGESIPLCYRWYYKSKPASDTMKIMLNHGDIYIMSEKAVGSDWKLSSKLTLRHSAGCSKYCNAL